MLEEFYIYKRVPIEGIDYSKTLKFIGILENFESAIWHERFFDEGELQITAPCTELNLNLLKTGNLVFKKDIVSDKMQTYMEIKQVQIDSDDENGDIITVTGVSSNELLKRRIVWYTQNFYDSNIIDIIYKLVLGEAGATVDSTKFPNLEVYERTNSSYDTQIGRSLDLYSLKKDRPLNVVKYITMQTTGKNLLEITKQLCQENGLGFKVTCLANYIENVKGTLNKLDGIFNKFQILVPSDRSDKIIFSEDFDNIYNATYVKNVKDYSNTALVAAQGEAERRKRIIYCQGQNDFQTDYASAYQRVDYKPKFTDFSRNEVYVDLRDSDNEEIGEVLNDTLVNYLTSLCKRAEENFGQIEEAFDCELYLQGVFKYNEDFFIGDYVTINKFNLTIKAQLIEVIESIDNTNGYTITPIFAY